MVVGFYNRKGGVGKTTLAVHTVLRAMELSLNNRLKDYDIVDILAVDMDEQGNFCNWLSSYKWKGQSSFNYEDNKHISVRFNKFPSIEDKENFDLVIVDFPPQIDGAKPYRNFVDVWVVPVSGRLSMLGASELNTTLSDLKKSKRVVVVPNMVDVRYAVGKKEIELIKTLADGQEIEQSEVFDMAVPMHQVVRRAELEGCAVWDVAYGTRAKATKHLQLIADWILRGKQRAKQYHKGRL